eukprot:COSAG02_NODE_1304_length_13353_cov_92.513883_10_plen_488_part_00
MLLLVFLFLFVFVFSSISLSLLSLCLLLLLAVPVPVCSLAFNVSGAFVGVAEAERVLRCDAGDIDDPPPAKKGRGPGRPKKDAPGPPGTAPPPGSEQTVSDALAALVATREERKAVRHAVMTRNIDAKLVSRKCIVLQPALQAALRITREKVGEVAEAPKKPRRKSTYRGVEPSGAAGWSAELIAKGGKRHYLGTYRTEEEAARAFDKKALELRGDKARLNFPPEGQGVKPPTDPEATATDFLGVYAKGIGGKGGGKPVFEARLSCKMLQGAEGVYSGSNQGTVMLGYFETALEAARAYDEVAGALGRRTNGVTWEQIEPMLVERRDNDHYERLSMTIQLRNADKKIAKLQEQLAASEESLAAKIAGVEAKRKQAIKALEDKHKLALKMQRDRLNEKRKTALAQQGKLMRAQVKITKATARRRYSAGSKQPKRFQQGEKIQCAKCKVLVVVPGKKNMGVVCSNPDCREVIMADAGEGDDSDDDDHDQ